MGEPRGQREKGLSSTVPGDLEPSGGLEDAWWGRKGVGEISRQSRLLMSTLHFSDGKDTDVSVGGDGAAAGLRAAVLTFLPSALSFPTFLTLREKSFPAVIRSPGRCRCIG